MKTFGDLKEGDVLYGFDLNRVFSKKVIGVKHCNDGTVHLTIDEDKGYVSFLEVNKDHDFIGNGYNLCISKDQALEEQKQWRQIRLAKMMEDIQCSLRGYEYEYKRCFDKRTRLVLKFEEIE